MSLCSPDVLSCNYVMEVFLEMLGWTLPKSWVRALWGEVWQGHCACGMVSRPGRFQRWQKLPQHEKDLLHSGDRRRTVWTWRSPFALQHRPCVVGPIICLRLGGRRGGGPKPQRLLATKQVYEVMVTFLVTFPLGLKACLAQMSVD